MSQAWQDLISNCSKKYDVSDTHVTYFPPSDERWEITTPSKNVYKITSLYSQANLEGRIYHYVTVQDEDSEYVMAFGSIDLNSLRIYTK